MNRGKKLDIFIGANINQDWAVVEDGKKSSTLVELLEPQKHFLFFKKEKRRGKTVTLVGEFHISSQEITTTLKNLKKKLGCGGTFKDGWMEFQGEIKEKIRELLVADGFRFKHGH